MEKFSVLISVYHREKAEYLREALISVFEQTVPPSQVVLVQDGSLTDELYAVIDFFKRKYNTLEIVVLPKNVGLGQALNEGLNYCSYELVARMDSDDICKPNRFEQQLTIFAAQPALTAVGSWVDEFDGSIDNIVSIRRLPKQDIELRRYATSRNPLNHPSVMFRKSAINSVGGYKHFYMFEDYYLWVRLLKDGFHIFNIQQSLLFFRTNSTMIARRGGWKYGVSELKFFYTLRKMGVIGVGAMLKNMLIRFPVRILPNKIRIFVYQKLLRG